MEIHDVMVFGILVVLFKTTNESRQEMKMGQQHWEMTSVSFLPQTPFCNV